ncbi:MAG: NAD(P)H-hydrate epimerase, partial [Nocardioides sp.]|uniref:NAD(P)H-hydrate epimerase n=1 Tax=Nocardioides sp. TaxID=35761 RepID=UPI0039E3BDD3
MIRAQPVERVRAAEATAMARLPRGALMERAAAGLAYAVIDLLGGAYGRRVLLLVGSGDNGGDTLYAGARLARRGARVEAWLLSDRVHDGGVTALRAAGGRVGGLDPARPPRAAYDVVLDGIVGIGGRSGLRPDAQAALAAVAEIPVVAVDVPSGVDVDGGGTSGPHVVADLTVTFGCHKPCHLLDPAAAACGVVQLVDIGLPGVGPAAGGVEALQAADVARLLPRPVPTAHKYTRGVVGLRTGSSRYPGAALLSVAGANSGLAGMVRYVGTAAETVVRAHPEVVGDGRAQAWVVGSGGGEQVGRELAAALATGVPVVIDADALGRLSASPP